MNRYCNVISKYVSYIIQIQIIMELHAIEKKVFEINPSKINYVSQSFSTKLSTKASDLTLLLKTQRLEVEQIWFL